MAKDRIDRNELAGKLMETATAAEDLLRTMAEMIADFVAARSFLASRYLKAIRLLP